MLTHTPQIKTLDCSPHLCEGGGEIIKCQTCSYTGLVPKSAALKAWETFSNKKKLLQA